MTKSSQNADQLLIRSIAKLLNEQNLAEIEIEREDMRVRVTRTFQNTMPQMAMPTYAPQPVAPAAPVPQSTPHATSAAVAAVAQQAADDLAANPGTLTSPLVGTAYLSPEPGKPTFAALGTRVTEGQTVLIIEAMKTMNQIPAHRSGTVTRILVDDSSPVEYGQPLVVIE